MFSNFFKTDTMESMMRLGFYTCVLAGCVGGIGLGVLDIIYNQGKNLASVALLIAAYLTPAFAGKQAQAKSELSSGANK